MNRNRKKIVGIVVFNGVEEQDFVGPFETLHIAASFGAPLSVKLLAERAPRQITGAYGLRFWVKDRLTPSAADILIVPGGGWLSRARTGTWAEVKRGVLPRLIAQAHSLGTVVATVCAGAMLATGLLVGRRAVTHRLVIKDLRRAGARIVRKRVVDDGDVVSSGGITAGIDLALRLVERLGGRTLARRVAHHLEYAQQIRTRLQPLG